MSSHPDADAFVRAILRDPAEVTTRLVFADWLEETEVPSNVAWARFIRLMAETNRHATGRPEHTELEQQAAGYWWQIDASLTVPAAVVMAHTRSLLQLLPAWKLTAKLGSIEVPQAIIELIPESVARENIVLPLYLQGWTLLIATEDPGNCDIIDKLTFILNKEIIAVRAASEELLAAINHHYGQTETESVDCVSYESPLIGLEGDENSSAIFGIFITAFSRGCSGFEMEGTGARSTLRYASGANPVPDEQLSSAVFSHLLDHLLSLPADAEYSEHGLRCIEFDIPLLSGRRFPATLERRPAKGGTDWFRVRFRWEDSR
jgi:uncharacterized protein (TIGR02996 family)